MKILRNLSAITLLVILLPQFVGAQSAADNDFPYELTWKRELLIGGVGLGTNGAAFLINQGLGKPTFESVSALDPADLSSIDRSATENFSPFAATSSDALVAGSAFASGILLFGNVKKPRKFFMLGAMYTEAMLLNLGVNYIIKNSLERPRPYLYNTSLTVDRRVLSGREGLRSFYSGHTSTAFVTAVFLSTTFCHINPNSKYKPLVWGASLVSATTVGYLRYAAGKHFPTDIVTGAVAGSFFGWLVPRLHEKGRASNLSVLPWTNPTENTVGLHLSLRL